MLPMAIDLRHWNSALRGKGQSLCCSEDHGRHMEVVRLLLWEKKWSRPLVQSLVQMRSRTQEVEVTFLKHYLD